MLHAAIPCGGYGEDHHRRAEREAEASGAPSSCTRSAASAGGGVEAELEGDLEEQGPKEVRLRRAGTNRGVLQTDEQEMGEHPADAGGTIIIKTFKAEKDPGKTKAKQRKRKVLAKGKASPRICSIKVLATA